MSEQDKDINDVFDEIIEIKNLDGQEGLAKYLALSEGTISNIRTGKAKYSKTSFKKYFDDGIDRDYYELLKPFVGHYSERARKSNTIKDDETSIIELGNARVTFRSASALEKADLRKIFSDLSQVPAFNKDLAALPNLSRT